MATILNFKRPAERRGLSLPAGHNADVVFFTGVRYERASAIAKAHATASPRKSAIKPSPAIQ